MSATWGYFSIEIKKSNKTMDKKLAQKIFDWCKEHFDWFGEGVENEQLCLEDGKIYSDNDFCVEDYSVEMEPLGWLNEVYEEFHPEQMIVRNVYHYTNAAGEYTPRSACFRLVAACVQDGELVLEGDFCYGEYEDPSFEDFFQFSYQADDFHGYMLGTNFRNKPDDMVRLCFKDGNRIIKELVELWPRKLNAADEIELAVINNDFCLTICDSEIPLLNAAGRVIDRFEKMDLEKTFKGTEFEKMEFLGIQWTSDGEIEMPKLKRDKSGKGPDLCKKRLKELEKSYSNTPLGIKNEFDYDDSAETYQVVIDVSVQELRNAIESSIDFTSDDFAAFMGVRLKISEKNISLAGCDGHQGGFGFVNVAAKGDDSCYVLSTNILKYLKENLSGESVKLKLSEDYVAFENDMIKCRSRLIEERYPNVDGVISQDFAFTLDVNRSELQASCQKLASKIKESFGLVILSYREGMLSVAIDDDSVAIKAAKDGGEQFDIGFDVNLLANVISKVKTDSLRMKFTSPTTVCVVEPVGSSDALFFVMPMRIS